MGHVVIEELFPAALGVKAEVATGDWGLGLLMDRDVVFVKEFAGLVLRLLVTHNGVSRQSEFSLIMLLGVW